MSKAIQQEMSDYRLPIDPARMAAGVEMKGPDATGAPERQSGLQVLHETPDMRLRRVEQSRPAFR